MEVAKPVAKPLYQGDPPPRFSEVDISFIFLTRKWASFMLENSEWSLVHNARPWSLVQRQTLMGSRTYCERKTCT